MMKQEQEGFDFFDEPDVSSSSALPKERRITPLTLLVNESQSHGSSSEFVSPFSATNEVFDNLFDDDLIADDDFSFLFDDATNDSTAGSCEKRNDSSNSTVNEFLSSSPPPMRTKALVEPLDTVGHLNEMKKGDNSFKCQAEGCSKVFEDKVALKNHVKTHRERRFVCNVGGCDKGFFEKSKLKRHQTVHTKVKGYSCPLCGQTFGYKDNVKTHMRVHTGEKPFKCSEIGCGKSFAQKSNLKTHEKTHLKRKRDCGDGSSYDLVTERDASLPLPKRQRRKDRLDKFDVLSEL